VPKHHTRKAYVELASKDPRVIAIITKWG